MIALDTNILARLLLRDDVPQYRRARALLAQDQTFTAPPTVLLELVSVLEANDCSAAEIVHGLSGLLGLPNFKPQAVQSLRQAVEWYRDGLDFADALHLALSSESESLVTFDKAFAKRATKLAAHPPVLAA
jgi:predicted nucleic acid-binding protein